MRGAGSWWCTEQKKPEEGDLGTSSGAERTRGRGNVGLPRWGDLGDPEVVPFFLKEAFPSPALGQLCMFYNPPHPGSKRDTEEARICCI